MITSILLSNFFKCVAFFRKRPPRIVVITILSMTAGSVIAARLVAMALKIV